MAHKLKLRDLGMDTMERLYYERKEARQKAYTAKRRKSVQKNNQAAKDLCISGSMKKKSTYYMC